MNVSNIITTVAGVLIGLPAVLNAIPNLNLTPEFNAVLAVGALIGAVILKQQRPSGEQVTADGELSDQEVERIAQARERIRRAEVAKVRAAGGDRG